MRLGSGAALAAGVLSALLSSCAPSPPRGPSEVDDYVFPGWAAGQVSREEARQIEKSWADLRAGDAAGAEKRMVKLLRRQPGILAAETTLAYAQLRAGRLVEAGRGFEAVLARSADYAPALVGAATVAHRQGNAEAALALLRKAAAADTANETVRRRLGEVRLQVTERRVAAARDALQAGQRERGIAEYRAALDAAPEVAGVRLALAELLAEAGDRAGAAAMLEADPTDDRQVLLRLGGLLGEMREYGRALEAYRRLLSHDPRDEEALAGSRRVREALEMLQMPEEYRRIPEAPTITRADLAALVIVKVTALSRLAPGPAKVAIDISGSWARDHIIRALALDIMTVYPNHTFQPAAVVRRGDLARTVHRVLELMKHPPGTSPALTDMSPNNLFYVPAGRAVAAGLMDLTPEGAFEAWRPVTGQEAADVIEGLVRLVGP